MVKSVSLIIPFKSDHSEKEKLFPTCEKPSSTRGVLGACSGRALGALWAHSGRAPAKRPAAAGDRSGPGPRFLQWKPRLLGRDGAMSPFLVVSAVHLICTARFSHFLFTPYNFLPKATP